MLWQRKVIPPQSDGSRTRAIKIKVTNPREQQGKSSNAKTAAASYNVDGKPGVLIYPKEQSAIISRALHRKQKWHRHWWRAKWHFQKRQENINNLQFFLYATYSGLPDTKGQLEWMHSATYWGWGHVPVPGYSSLSIACNREQGRRSLVLSIAQLNRACKWVILVRHLKDMMLVSTTLSEIPSGSTFEQWTTCWLIGRLLLGPHRKVNIVLSS